MPLVLVVDDDDGVRSVFQDVLESEGFEVATASNGHDALARYRSRRPDVVITDVLMPKLSGIDLVNRLLAEDRYARIIAISGVVGAQFLEAGRALGVRRIFEKPIDVNVIVAAVKELAAEGWQGEG